MPYLIITFKNFLLDPEAWCAKIYKDYKYGTWEKKLFQTDIGSLLGTDADNQVSAAKIRKGCTLTGYDANDRLTGETFRLTHDVDKIVDGNDKMTSYTCKCQSTPTFVF